MCFNSILLKKSPVTLNTAYVDGEAHGEVHGEVGDVAGDVAGNEAGGVAGDAVDGVVNDDVLHDVLEYERLVVQNLAGYMEVDNAEVVGNVLVVDNVLVEDNVDDDDDDVVVLVYGDGDDGLSVLVPFSIKFYKKKNVLKNLI